MRTAVIEFAPSSASARRLRVVAARAPGSEQALRPGHRGGRAELVARGQGPGRRRRRRARAPGGDGPPMRRRRLRDLRGGATRCRRCLVSSRPRWWRRPGRRHSGCACSRRWLTASGCSTPPARRWRASTSRWRGRCPWRTWARRSLRRSRQVRVSARRSRRSPGNSASPPSPPASTICMSASPRGCRGGRWLAGRVGALARRRVPEPGSRLSPQRPPPPLSRRGRPLCKPGWCRQRKPGHRAPGQRRGPRPDRGQRGRAQRDRDRDRRCPLIRCLAIR